MKRKPQEARSDAQITRFWVHDDEYFVLSYELPRWSLPSTLTAAEREVVEAVLAGVERSELALRRGSSQRTIANLLARAFRKLGVHSRMELAAQLARATLATRRSR